MFAMFSLYKRYIYLYMFMICVSFKRIYNAYSSNPRELAVKLAADVAIERRTVR